MATAITTLLHFPATSPSNSNPLLKPPHFSLSSSSPSLSSKTHLLNLISDQDRGLKTQTNPNLRSQIIDAIDSLAILGKDSITTGPSLSGTWRLLWTTEKEQLFIIQNANWFGTKTGDVLQVIDVEKLKLNNVITFPPSGVFFVRSSMEIASNQRVNFRGRHVQWLASSDNYRDMWEACFPGNFGVWRNSFANIGLCFVQQLVAGVNCYNVYKCSAKRKGLGGTFAAIWARMV